MSLAATTNRDKHHDLFATANFQIALRAKKQLLVLSVVSKGGTYYNL